MDNSSDDEDEEKDGSSGGTPISMQNNLGVS